KNSVAVAAAWGFLLDRGGPGAPDWASCSIALGVSARGKDPQDPSASALKLDTPATKGETHDRGTPFLAAMLHPRGQKHRVHPDRVACGYCNHCNPRGHPLPRLRSSARQGTRRRLLEQHPADCSRGADVYAG